MLNASKILLVLPEVAFAAELLPGKQPNTFSIQNCSQYLSPFLEGIKFNGEKLYKLFHRIQKDEPYALVLPDDLFFNKIVSVSKESDSAIRDELKGVILPSLNVSEETHDIVTTVLNVHKGETRIQISAVSRAVLGPIRAVAEKTGATISNVVPLSFALKSIISLEPSVSAVQLGDSLYIAQHYIGVSDCQRVPATEIEKAVELIKGFKKAEPSTMTVYALTNPLIGSQLKEGLKQIIPLQQMSETVEGSKLPGAVTTAIESIARSLSSDFPIPLFDLGKASRDELDALVVGNAGDDADELDDDTSSIAEVDTKAIEEEDEAEAVPAEKAPSRVAPEPVDEKVEAEGEETMPKVTTVEEIQVEESDLPKPSHLGGAAAVAAAAKQTADEGPTIKLDALSELGDEPTPSVQKTPDITIGKVKDLEESLEEKVAILGNKAESTVDLSALSRAQSGSSTDNVKPVPSKDGGKKMNKMILTTLGVFLITVLLGGAAGFWFIRFNQSSESETPTVTVEPTMEPEPVVEQNETAEEATESAQTTDLGAEEKAALSIYVVNATGRSGHAGTFRTRLTTAGFSTVAVGNTNSEEGYEDEGNFIFMKDGSNALLEALSTATKLTLTEDADLATVEDSAGKYDVIIVLNE